MRRGASIRPGLLAAALWLALAVPAAAIVASQPAMPAAVPTPEVMQFAASVVAAADNKGLAFVVVDKRNASVVAYTPAGAVVAAAPALLGLARGDDNPPGIGAKLLSAIGPAERITPAGRFTASLGRDLGTDDVLWIDYDSGLSMHRVIRGKPADARLRRLSTPTPDDNRISYGCINVPVAFFETIIRPLFDGATGIVYILPETRSVADERLLRAAN